MSRPRKINQPRMRLVLTTALVILSFAASALAMAETNEAQAVVPQGWESIQGTWEVREWQGEPALYNEYTGIALAPLEPVADFSYAASALSVSGEGGGLHLLFRYRDLNNYYMFRITPASQVAEFYIRYNGRFEMIEARPVEVARETWYRLRVTAVGNEIHAYLDGELLFHIVDDRIASGRLGFRSHGSESYFKDVVVGPADSEDMYAKSAGSGPSGGESVAVSIAQEGTPMESFEPRPMNERVKIPGPGERSMWVWKTEEIILDPQAQDRFFRFLNAPHGRSDLPITTLFLLPEWVLNDTSSLRDSVLIPRLQQFVARATAEGVTVNYMNGVHEWRFRQNHPSAMAAVRRVLDYNEASPPESRFNGIHLDIEKVKDVPVEYMELVRAIAAEIDSRGADIALGFDLPPWLHDAAWGFLDQQVLDVADYIALMDYWDTADEIIRDAIGPLSYAAQIGKKVVVGVDVSSKSDPRQLFTTFYDEGWVYMEQELARVHEALLAYESYAGIAIHSYDHYIYLPRD